MVRRLRLGIIGTGVASRDLYLPAFGALRHRIDLVACANRTRSKADAYAALAGVGRVHDTAQQVIDDPDVEAVLLSLPIDQLPEHVLAALRAGKAVISEKPIAPDAAAGRRLLRAAARYDAPYMVGENFAFMSHAHLLAKWIATGKLGEIRYAEVRQTAWMDAANKYARTTWRQTPAHVGGFVADGGVHVANVVRRCLGEPTKIRGLSAQFDPQLPPVDTVVAALEFPSGALGTWTTCFTSHAAGPTLSVMGSKGTARWFDHHVEFESPTGVVTRANAKENSFTGQFRNFADVVVAGKPMVVTPAETLRDLQLIERLLRGR